MLHANRLSLPQRPARLLFAALLLGMPACQAKEASTGDSSLKQASAPPSTRVDLTGAGATFPYPLYSRWFNDYAQRTNVRINYQSIGSGGGIRQVLEHTVDFGATDVPMTEAELTDAGNRIEHLPTSLGAVALTYNLPEVQKPLRMSGPVIAGIFLGRIKRWNDPALKALNPEQSLPARDILLVHRSDGSGTSYIMSDYLSSVSKEWADGPGRSKDVRWPAGVGGRGNEGVAGQVKAMEGAFGYIEVVYARQNFLPVVHIQNRAGVFAPPQAHEIAEAASNVVDSLPASTDLRISLVNAAGKDSYPLTSFTWLLLDPKHIGPQKTAQMIEFLRWALSDGESVAAELGYVPLPTAVAARVTARLNVLTANTPR